MDGWGPRSEMGEACRHVYLAGRGRMCADGAELAAYSAGRSFLGDKEISVWLVWSLEVGRKEVGEVPAEARAPVSASLVLPGWVGWVGGLVGWCPCIYLST